MAAAAVAQLTCCANSHPFQERHVTLSESVKIGRSVAQSRPAQTNAIFDCKVLSRHHALLWYENGKFYLQDTKSSNGTFVNSHRLSKGSEESMPYELFSNDTVQFGVDVMENSRKVTHSCIIATIQLFHPDGREALTSSVGVYSNVGSNAIHSQELCQLSQYLQEALHREQMLENKLTTLQSLVVSTKAASEGSWQALVDEDRLLSRLGLLENQLSVYAKNHTEDSLKHELMALHADKFGYENTAKESLRQVLEEKLEAVRKVSELENALKNVEEECTHLQMMYQSSQEEIEQLAERSDEHIQEIRDLNDKIQDSEKHFTEECERLFKEKETLEAQVESLQADNDFTHEQLNNMKAKMESSKMISTECIRIPECNSCGIQVDLINLLDLQMLQGSDEDDEVLELASIPTDRDVRPEVDGQEGDKSDTAHFAAGVEACHSLPTASDGQEPTGGTSNDRLAELRVQLQQYQDQLQKLTSQLEDSQDVVLTLQRQLLAAEQETASQAVQIKSLQGELSEARQHAVTSEVMKADSELKTELSAKSKESIQQEILHLKDRLDSVQQLTDAGKERMRVETVASAADTHLGSMHIEMQRESAKNRAEFAALKEECANLRLRIQDIESEMKKSHLENMELKAEYTRLQESYRELEQTKDTLEDTKATCQLNLTDAQKEAEKTRSELSAARIEISQLQGQCKEQQELIDRLKEELQNTVDEYGTLSYQSRTLSTCALAPLVLLLLAVLIAFYPLLSTLTVTTSPPGT